jgi:hypothetical protein
MQIYVNVKINTQSTQGLGFIAPRIALLPCITLLVILLLKAWGNIYIFTGLLQSVM